MQQTYQFFINLQYPFISRLLSLYFSAVLQDKYIVTTPRYSSNRRIISSISNASFSAILNAVM